jgi:hypothetical protein
VTAKRQGDNHETHEKHEKKEDKKRMEENDIATSKFWCLLRFLPFAAFFVGQL